jgi:hypothetical protein
MLTKNMRYFCNFPKKLPKVNNRLKSENSPNLVTLFENSAGDGFLIGETTARCILKLCPKQGDQIWRIFGYWAIVYF